MWDKNYGFANAHKLLRTYAQTHKHMLCGSVQHDHDQLSDPGGASLGKSPYR